MFDYDEKCNGLSPCIPSKEIDVEIEDTLLVFDISLKNYIQDIKKLTGQTRNEIMVNMMYLCKFMMQTHSKNQGFETIVKSVYGNFNFQDALKYK